MIFVSKIYLLEIKLVYSLLKIYQITRMFYKGTQVAHKYYQIWWQSDFVIDKQFQLIDMYYLNCLILYARGMYVSTICSMSSTLTEKFGFIITLLTICKEILFWYYVIINSLVLQYGNDNDINNWTWGNQHILHRINTVSRRQFIKWSYILDQW